MTYFEPRSFQQMCQDREPCEVMSENSSCKRGVKAHDSIYWDKKSTSTFLCGTPGKEKDKKRKNRARDRILFMQF